MSKRVGKGSSDLLSEYLDLLHISGMVEARNFKYGMINVDHERH